MLCQNTILVRFSMFHRISSSTAQSTNTEFNLRSGNFDEDGQDTSL